MSGSDYDIIIAGAGLAGATFALAASQGGMKVCVVDPQPFESQLAPTFDGRSTAIAYSTFRMLDTLGIGERLRPHACRMDHILVTDGQRPGASSRPPSPAFIRFDAEEIGDRNGGEPLGYMLENRRIRQALSEALSKADIDVIAPAMVDKVDVGAGLATVARFRPRWWWVPKAVGRPSAAKPRSRRWGGSIASRAWSARSSWARTMAMWPTNISCRTARSPSCP